MFMILIYFFVMMVKPNNPNFYGTDGEIYVQDFNKTYVSVAQFDIQNHIPFVMHGLDKMFFHQDIFAQQEPTFFWNMVFV